MINIKVVGPGCFNCQKLESLCTEVVNEEHLDAQIEKITDVSEFADLGIYLTPGLIVNDKVASSGKIPDKPSIKKWLTEASK